MEFEGGIVALIIYAVVALLSSVGKARKRQASRQERAARREREALAQRGVQVAERPTTMQELLDEMRRELERATAQTPPPWDPARDNELDRDDEEPEFTSLEEEPEVVSLETERPQVERPAWDADAGAEEVVRRRIAAAELRNREWIPDDHRKFDARIRAPQPLDQVDDRRAVDLKRALIWREILGPPVGWPDRERP